MKQKEFIALIIVLLFLGIANVSFSQDKCWVFLSDKNTVSFNPYAYFDAKAIDRRIKNGLPLDDYSDYPLNKDYVNEIKNHVYVICGQSRWFNAVAVKVDPEQRVALEELPFVDSVVLMNMYPIAAGYNKKDYSVSLDDGQKELLYYQLERHGASDFYASDIDGKGVRIAIFDGGFPTVDESPVFEHIRNDGRIIKTWDFSKDKEFVYSYNAHGAMVLSCIAGIVDGRKIGMATGAEFLLARTEISPEPFSEEENWLEAMEWADKNGADIINSSLGYTYHRYFTEQMNGKTSLVSRAANLAARKGILVVNAAGNDGSAKWKIVGCPADADSVLSVGGINPDTDYHTSFSSYGPTADKRRKPNVCAYGHVIAAGKKGITNTQGTSFSSPIVAGFAACVKQLKPELKSMELFREIEKSGDLYPYFDYSHGYGVPQASYFVNEKQDIPVETFQLEGDSIINVEIMPEFIPKNIGFVHEKAYLFYNVEDKNGVLIRYGVVSVYDADVLQVKKTDFSKGVKLNLFYKGYYKSYEL